MQVSANLSASAVSSTVALNLPSVESPSPSSVPQRIDLTLRVVGFFAAALMLLLVSGMCVAEVRMRPRGISSARSESVHAITASAVVPHASADPKGT